MKRVIKHLHKTFTIVLITVFLIISLGVLAINSPWGKHKIKSYVISFFNQTGYEIKIDKFLSKSPLDYHLKTIHVKISDTESIDIDEIKLTLSISSIFFKRKIIIDNFYAKNIYINILKKQNTPSILLNNKKISKKFEISWPKFPFGISLNRFEIENLKVPINNNKTSFNIAGDAHLRRSSNFNLNIKIERERFENSNVLIKLSGHEKSKQIVIKTYLKTKTLKVFSPFYDNKFDCETDIFISLKGHFKNFLNELNLSDQKHLEPILGKIDGNISSINFLKNKKVSIFSKFSIKEFLKFNKIEIKSSNFEIDGDILFTKNFSLKNSNLRIKTQKIDEILPINKNIFYGDLDANLKLYSEDKNIFADINYKLINCEINNRYVSTFKGILNSKYENKNIFSKINSEIILPDSSPLNLYADLKLFNFKNLLVENFSLKSKSTSSTGFLEFIDNKINGNFSGSFENAKELAYFLPFRPFQAKATFSLDFYTEQETNDQLANLSMDFTNFYISEVKGDHFNLNLKIFKPFQIPEFDVEIRGKNSFYKKLKIEKILLKTQKQDNKYPINFQFTGFLHKNIDLYLRGLWDFRDNNKISVKTLSGIFLDENITKSTPFDILLTDDKFEIPENLY